MTNFISLKLGRILKKDLLELFEVKLNILEIGLDSHNGLRLEIVSVEIVQKEVLYQSIENYTENKGHFLLRWNLSVIDCLDQIQVICLFELIDRLMG